MSGRRRMAKNCLLFCSILILSGCKFTSDTIIRTNIEPCPPKAITLMCPPTPVKDIQLGERLDRWEEREECLLEWLALWRSGWGVCDAEL